MAAEKLVLIKKNISDYFQGYPNYISTVKEPFVVINKENAFDIMATVKGSGQAAQSEAIRHGISKALLIFDPTLRQSLKRKGLLTRDPRAKERKKPGKKGARASFQWSKR